MIRLLVLLPLCLSMVPGYPQEPGAPVHDDARPVRNRTDRPQLIALLSVAPQAAFPASLPWPAVGLSGRLDASAAINLPHDDPVVFMQQCLKRYDREVHGYDCVMSKREKIDGRLYPPETVRAFFKEKPFSVFMRWLQGARGAQCALYVEGQNGGKLLALPAGLLGRLGVFEKDPSGTEAKQSGRYPITEFGIKIGMVRTLDSWLEARSHNALHLAYLGVYRVPEAGDRECFKLRRTRYARPENDGITDLTLYIDRETWLQVGSVLRGADGNLIAEYYFRDIHVNPKFAEKQFERSALTP